MNIDQLFERLKSHYPDCEITRSGNTMTLHLPLAEVHASDHHADFFLCDQLLSSLNMQGEDLYEVIENFICDVREGVWENNPVLTETLRRSKRAGRRILIPGGIGGIALAVLSIVTKTPLLLTAVLLFVLLLVFVRKRRLGVFEESWICPHCSTRLPVSKTSFFTKPSPVAACPHCGKSLIDQEALAKSLRENLSLYEEILTEEEIGAESPAVLPPYGPAKVLSVLIGILCLLAVPLCGSITAVLSETLPPAVLSVSIAAVVLTGAAGLLLLFCKNPVEDAAIRESRAFSWLGAILSVLCLGFLVFSFAISSASSADAVGFLLLALLFLYLSIFMLLDSKNRAVCLRPSSIVYVNSFGRMYEFEISEIHSVLIKSPLSIHVTGPSGRKLFSVEGNMIGVSSLLGWANARGIPVETADGQKKQTPPVPDEGRHTAMHDHLLAIRIGLILTVLLFGAGEVCSLLLHMSGRLSIRNAIYLCCFSPVPLVLYTLLFVPVFLFDPPENMSMYIKFPTLTVLFLSLLCFWETHYYWGKYVLQIVDFWRFSLIALAIAVPLFLVLLRRAPKSLRNPDSIFRSAACLLIFSSSFLYGGLLALSTPVDHYPAVVTERSESSSDSSASLTIRLSDGTPLKMSVTDHLYELESAGEDFVVCQRDTPLGIRLVRLHLPESK